MSQEKDLLTDLEQNVVTPEYIVWVLLCQGKITVEQALAFHTNNTSLEQLVKDLKE